jgi:hypothetical protein
MNTLEARMQECQRLAAMIVTATAAAWPHCAGVRADVAGAPPPQPNYYQDTLGTLQAQVQEAPALYQSEAAYQPGYAQLNLNNLNTLLNGGGGQPGIVQQYTQNLIPAQNQAQIAATSAQRQADVGNVLQLGPQATAAIGAANPGAASLLASLTQQGQAGLNAGTGLTADQQRQLNNSVAAAQGSRGMAYGPAPAYAQVLANSQFGNQQQQQRQQFATGLVGVNQQYFGDPFEAILGRPSSAAQNAYPMINTGNQMQPGRQFNPDDPFAQSLYSQYNQEMTQWNAYGSPMSIAGSVTSGIGNIMGGAMKA